MDREEMWEEYHKLESEAVKTVRPGKKKWARVRAEATRNFIHYFLDGIQSLTDHHFRYGDIDYWTSGKWYNRVTGKKGEDNIVNFAHKYYFKNKQQKV